METRAKFDAMEARIVLDSMNASEQWQALLLAHRYEIERLRAGNERLRNLLVQLYTCAPPGPIILQMPSEPRAADLEPHGGE
jgi:hypothetical protein